MMGRLSHDQEQFFYSFRLEEALSDDHPVREIAAVLDLSWVHSELAPYYSRLGRPSIDPVLMIRMLIVGYVFAIRSERALCRDVRVNLAYRWFCGLSIEDKIPDHSAFSRARNERFRNSEIFRSVFERVSDTVFCLARLFFRPKCDAGHRFLFQSLLTSVQSERSKTYVVVELNLPTQSEVPHASHHFHPVLRDCLDLDSGMRLCAKDHIWPGNHQTLHPGRG
jgi:transposase